MVELSIRRLGLMMLLAAALPVAAEAAVYGVSKDLNTALGTQMFRFNETGPANVVFIGQVTNVGVGVDVDGLAVSPTLGMFGFQFAGTGAGSTSQLVALTPDTATATSIGGALVGRRIMGAAFSIDAHTLYGLDAFNSQLVIVDPSTGSLTSSINLTLGGSAFAVNSDVVDIAFDRNNNLFLSVGNTVENTYYQLDPGSGELTAIFSVAAMNSASQNLVGGVAFSGLANDPTRLFTLNLRSNDDLGSYNLASPPGLLVRVTDFALPFGFNGSTGDLAALVYVPEPSALLVLAFGAVHMIRRRQR